MWIVWLIAGGAAGAIVTKLLAKRGSSFGGAELPPPTWTPRATPTYKPRTMPTTPASKEDDWYARRAGDPGERWER